MLLRLNARRELVNARFRSWRHVVRIFSDAAGAEDALTADDVEDLRCLPVADAFHHFAHDVSTDRLRHKGVPQRILDVASRNLPTLRTIFPRCEL